MTLSMPVFGSAITAAAISLVAATAAAAELRVPPGFTVSTIAHVAAARELVALPDGDVVVGTGGHDVFVVRDAEGSAPAVVRLAHLPDEPAAGVAYSAAHRELYVATEDRIYAGAYTAGTTAFAPAAIARVRTGAIAPHSDGDVHVTTSLAFDDATDTLYASVGSSCNACKEVDPTRAAIIALHPDGTHAVRRAIRIRNAIALTVDPKTGALWAGDAGQDTLPFGHPYDFLDDVSAHAGIADYGWPDCEENHRAYVPGADCASVVQPLVELPAYSTIVGATFYPGQQRGRFAFPTAYRDGLLATAHGSWHRDAAGGYAAKPLVAFIPIKHDRPVTAVDWNDPHRQWSVFVGGFQPNGHTRIGRPTGIAVGSQGSVFVADDTPGSVYRIRPPK